MAITTTVSFKTQAAGVSQTIVSNSLSVSTGDFLAVIVDFGDNADATSWTISNTGTAIAWTQRAATNTASNTKLILWTGTAGATPPTTVTVVATVGSGTGSKVMAVLGHTGAHATTPIPAGNIFSGTSGHNASQSITPTSSGSALWMMAGDWSATNTFVAGTSPNTTFPCTFGATTYHEAGQQTVALIRPTTQPRTDAAAFTLSETDTGGKISWIAFEVQAAAGAAVALTSRSLFVRQAVNRAGTY